MTSLNLLVVDDEKGLRELLVRFLTTNGHRAIGASSAEEALGCIGREDFDIIITDIALPGIDGIQLLQSVKENRPDLDFIVITGYGDKYSYNDVVARGASDFLVKPFKVEELDAKLKRVVRERALVNELKVKTKLLNELAITDDLTNLFNRRHFYKELGKEIARAKRQGHQLSLILFDLDRFKQFNDTFGHLEGDKVLIKIGQILPKLIRKNVDSVYRTGGDEFAIILIETTREQSEKVAEKVRRAFEYKFRNLTLSVGLAQLGPEHTAESLFKYADDALYEAKYSGGNKVCVKC